MGWCNILRQVRSIPLILLKFANDYNSSLIKEKHIVLFIHL